MPTHEHDDALAGMDYETARSLPRNPYTHAVQAIPEGHGPQPNLAELAGPMYPGGLMTLEAESHEKIESDGGYPVPDAAEYGDEKTGTHTVAEAQGVVATPTVPPTPDVLPGYSAHKRMFYQSEQANKTPDDWNVQSRVVPQTVGNVELLVGQNQHRDELLITNNGTNTVLIGRTENGTPTQGYPIPAGGTFTLKSQGPVYAYVASNLQTTLNVVETVFSQYQSFDRVTGHGN